jgi:hypothetical protein
VKYRAVHPLGGEQPIPFSPAQRLLILSVEPMTMWADLHAREQA